MSYPLRYRDVRPQQTFRPTARGPAQILRFPGTYNRALSFGPATRLPGRGSFGLLRPAAPALERAALARLSGAAALRFAGRLVPWVGVALTAWDLWEAFNGGQVSRNYPMVNFLGSSWQHVCGPTAYPGPPYRNQVHWQWSSPTDLTCNVPLALQAPGARFDQAPLTTDKTLIMVYGPHEGLAGMGVFRYYWFDHWSTTINNNGAFIGKHLLPLSRPLVVPGVMPGVDPLAPPYPGVGEPQIAPLPVWATPYIRPPVFPEAPVRGYEVDLPRAPRFEDYPASRSHPGLRVRLRSANRSDRRRPPRRERERKFNGKNKVEQMAVAGFRFLSQFGSVNSAVTAFWRAIPPQYRSRGRVSFLTKYREIYANWNRIAVDQAFMNAFAFWIRYKLAGMFYGAAFRATQDQAGVRQGVAIYRGLATLEGIRPHPTPIEVRRRAAEMEDQ